MKRLISCVCVLAAAATFAPLVQPAVQTDDPTPVKVAISSDAGTDILAGQMLSDIEREQLQAAQSAADPALAEQRGGILVLLVVALIILLIVMVAD